MSTVNNPNNKLMNHENNFTKSFEKEFECAKYLLALDCPKSGPGQVQGIFSGLDPGPQGSVQSSAGPGPGPHWTRSTGVRPGSGQVQTWTWQVFY